MSLFASPELAAAIAEAEQVATRRAVVACAGRTLPVVLAAGSPVVDRVWLDYLEPDDDAGEPEQTVRYAPRVVLGMVEKGVWLEELAGGAGPCRIQAAPTIDLTTFASWDEAQAWFCIGRSKHLKDLARHRRRAERELGPVHFDPDERDGGAFEQLLTWKRAHYARTGVGDPLAVPANIGLLRALHRSGALELCTLRAGGQLLAAIAVVRQAGRTYYWMPSYDTDQAALRPGSVLLVDAIRHAYEHGDREFDFMIGDEAYKWQYATHTRLVGALGTAPMSDRVRRVAGRARRRILAASASSAGA